MRVLLLGLAVMSLFLFPQTARSQGIPTCVEVTATDIPVSARRRATASDCDPSTARTRAIFGARSNASGALAPTCIARTTHAMAVRVCATVNKAPATTFGVVETNPAATAGSTTPNAAIGIGQTGAGGLHLCTVVRDLPHEAASSTTKATIDNGFCIFNNGRVTNFTARARARCAIACS
jgi:hypothetical protein